jgi:hypothetical protein
MYSRSPSTNRCTTVCTFVTYCLKPFAADGASCWCTWWRVLHQPGRWPRPTYAEGQVQVELASFCTAQKGQRVIGISVKRCSSRARRPVLNCYIWLSEFLQRSAKAGPSMHHDMFNCLS